jgi:hypothetical protein
MAFQVTALDEGDVVMILNEDQGALWYAVVEGELVQVPGEEAAAIWTAHNPPA